MNGIARALPRVPRIPHAARARLASRDIARPDAQQRLIRPIERPPIGDHENRLAFLPDALEIPRQIRERGERALLVAPRDERLRDALVEAVGLRGGAGRRLAALLRVLGVALLVLLLDRILRVQLFAVAPEPVLRQIAFDRRGAPRQREVGGRHLRRHHGIGVVRPDDALEQREQRLLQSARSAEVHVVGVEEEDEQPPAGLDALEGLHRLRRAILTDFEIVRGQVVGPAHR